MNSVDTVVDVCDETNPAPPCTRRLIEMHCDREGITKAEFARRAGVSVKTVYGWFHGGRPRDLSHVAALLGTDEGLLLEAATVTPCPTPDRRRPRTDNPGGAALRQAITAAGLTRAEVVRRSGVARTVLYSLLSGERSPTTGTTLTLANALGLDPVELARAFGEQVENRHDEDRIRLGCSRTEYIERLGVSRETLWGELTHHHAVCRGVLRTGGSPADAAEAAAQARRRSGFAAPTEFGRLIDTHVDSTGSTTAKLADALGVSRQAITSWRFGYCRPSPGNLERLAEITGAPLDQLADALDRAPVPWATEGETLRAARVAAGLNQAELAVKIAVSEPQVSSLETGKARITERIAAAASAALGVTVHAAEPLHRPARTRSRHRTEART